MANLNLNVQLKDIEKVNYAFSQAPLKLGIEIQKSLKLIGYRVQRLAKQNAPKDTGVLVNRIDVEAQPLKVIVASKANYSVYVHEGTKPHYPPIDKIKGWSKRHGINPYLVARGISKNGTKANPFMKDALEESTSYAEDKLNSALEIVLDDIAKNAS